MKQSSKMLKRKSVPFDGLSKCHLYVLFVYLVICVCAHIYVFVPTYIYIQRDIWIYRCRHKVCLLGKYFSCGDEDHREENAVVCPLKRIDDRSS